MQAGEYWYAMQDPEGEPQGYARLVVGSAAQGASTYAWTLRIAFAGGTYEEERSLTLDAGGVLLASGYRAGASRVEARREGDRLVGTSCGNDGEESAIDLEVEDDALSGMGFVRAASLERETGASLAFTDYDEASGFVSEGRGEIVVGERERVPLPGGDVDAWKVVVKQGRGGEIPLWVDDDGVIVRADWGGGNLMVLHESSTEHLFQPRPPVVREVPAPTAKELVLEGDVAGAAPGELFRWWTEPDRLEQWWPHEAEVGAAEGEPYRLRWKEPAWFLDGVITRYEPPSVLGFAWVWAHRPEAPPLEVVVDFEDAVAGTHLRITQGPYRDTDEDRRERDGHRQGWEVVCTRLADAVARGG